MPRKRKRGGGSQQAVEDPSPASGAAVAVAQTGGGKSKKTQRKSSEVNEGEEPKAVNSNWMQLQATLVKSHGTSSRKQRPTHVADLDSSMTAGVRGNGLTTAPLLPTSDDMSVTRALALDCEMVGVGFNGKRSALARVSLVNQSGNVVYDKHVRPREFVKDFRTAVSGVRPRDLRKAEDMYTVQKEVADLLKGRILVGHALHNDLKVLMLSHPRKHIRDTQNYPLFRNNARPRALRHLASLHLGFEIQDGEHDSVEDARAAMALYQLVKGDWEKSLRHKTEAITSHALEKKPSKIAT